MTKSFLKLTLSASAVALLATSASAEIKVGFIGSLSSDTGLSTLRGAEIAIEELNATGGVMGEMITMVSADTGEDVTEGIKAYEYLAETEEVDFIISGSIDDVSLGWLPRMQEYQTPTLDTWTSYIGIIDMVAEDPEGPPDARRREQALLVVDDHPVAVADPHLAHAGDELLHRRQHMRQRRVLVGDVVDIEEPGTGDVPLVVDLTPVAPIVRQVHRGIQDADVRRVQPLGQPLG